MVDLDPAGFHVNRVYITRELLTRPIGRTDPAQEKAALLDLAYQMANAPAQVLPRFVRQAMAVTGAVSAGLNLLDGPDSDVFTWRHLKGDLAILDGTDTPREASPSGVTLDQNATVLASHPESLYDWIAQAGLTLPEVLLMPLYFGADNPSGVLWLVSRAEGHFHGGHVRALIEIASFAGTAIAIARSRDKLEEALDQQALFAREMGHRLNNLFAIADGLVRISARQATTVAEMAQSLSGRLRALARANALAARQLDAGASQPAPATLAAVIEAVLSPYSDGHGPAFPSLISLSGPHITCGPNALGGLALLFHELATNAVKHGALRDEGEITVDWRLEGETVAITWTEYCDMPLQRVSRATGFGSILLDNTVAKQFEGRLDHHWGERGLVVTIRLPWRRLAA